ncbi:MAG: polysaccharide deacetylase family protein [Bacteroidia bacterium]
MIQTLKISALINSKRSTFVFDLVFKQILGIEYELISNSETANIVYSKTDKNQFSINIPVCSELLSSEGFEPINVPFKNSGAETILFPNENPEPGVWDFDLFAAIFYLVSRYEEYTGFEPDAHKRFPPEASILHQTQSFEFPLVNIWVQKLKIQLLAKWPDLKFNEPAFRFISTIDIDSTFQYREKGFWWSLSGFLKDIFKINFEEVKDRYKTLTGIKKDAFDVYDYLEILHNEFKTEVIYFWLLGNYSPFDKNINWKNAQQAKIIQNLIKSNFIGIHPSYQSNSNPELLATEIIRLKTITNDYQKGLLSRQHFLIHQFPKTYQNLIEQEVNEDYTLGYTSQYGFRAGIASPFYFYDLEKEETTNLLLYPFYSMDITPLHYYKLTPEQAIEKNLELLKRVKEVNGTFISLWHNESLSGQLRWKGGWEKVYWRLVKDSAELMKP